jgi:hypothetical protein
VRVGTEPPRGLGSPPLRLLLGVLGELALIAAALSAALLLFTPWLDGIDGASGLLVGFGLVAAATLVCGVLESLGRAPAVLLAVLSALAAEAALRWSEAEPFPGVGLAVAGALATALLLPVAVLALGRPARTLATTLWIS